MVDQTSANTDKLLIQLNKSLELLIKNSSLTNSSGHQNSSGNNRKSSNALRGTTDSALQDANSSLKSWRKNLDALTKVSKTLLNSTIESVDVTDENGKIIKKNVNPGLEQFSNALNESSNYLSGLDAEVYELTNKSISQMQRAFKTTVRSADGLSTSFSKNQKNASLLSAALINSYNSVEDGSFEFANTMNEFSEISKKVHKGMLVSAGLWDEANNSLRKDVSAKDFETLRLKMGEAQIVISETIGKFSKFGISSFDDLQIEMSKHKEGIAGKLSAGGGAGLNEGIPEELSSMLISLAKSGVDVNTKLDASIVSRDDNGEIFLTQENVDALKNLFNDVGQFQKLTDTIDEIKTINTGFEKASDEIDHLAKVINTDGAKLAHSLKDLPSAVAAAKDKLVDMLDKSSMADSLKRAAEHISTMMKQLQDFNIAQIPASFADVNYASIKLGMSFDDTVQFMNDNRKAMSIYGDDFSGLTDQFKGTFEKFGYTMAQGAKMVGPALEGAIATGINFKDGNALNNFVDQTMKEFKELGPLIGGTVEEYAKLNVALLQSEDISNIMLGLSNQQAKAYANNLTMERKELVMRGVSLEQAQALIQAQEAAKREKVNSRVRGAAIGMMMAQQAGISQEDSARAMQIQMQGKSASQENSRWLTETYAPMMARAIADYENQYQGTGIVGAQMSVDVIKEKYDESKGAFGNVVDQASKVAQADKANAGTSQEQLNAAEAKAAPNKVMGEVGQVFNQISSVINNVFLTSILGASGSLALFALQLANTASLMRGGGGLLDMFKGGAKGIPTAVAKGGGSKGSGLLSKGSGLLSKGAGFFGDLIGGTASGGGGLLNKGGAVLGKGMGMLSKIAAPLVGILSAGEGIVDLGGLATGKTDIGDWSKENGNFSVDKLFSPWAMGKYAGAKINDMMPGGSLGSTVYDMFNSDPLADMNKQAIPMPHQPPSVTATQAKQQTADVSGAQNIVNKISDSVTDEKGILKVTDSGVITQLLMIAENTAKMASLIQVIADSGLKTNIDLPPKQIQSSRRVATAYEYQTGKTI